MTNEILREKSSAGNPLGARMLAVAFACAAGSLFGDDAVSLKKSDADTWKDGGVTQSSMSSFLKNHDGYTQSGVDLSQYGWSDGNDPDPSKDYVVNDNKTLFSPYVAATVTKAEVESMCFTFPGNSLTLDNGTLGNRSCNDNGPAEVCVPNLIVKKGTFTNQSWSRNNRWSGTFTIDSSSYGYPTAALSFNINMKECFIDATMIAAAPNQVAFGNPGLGPSSGSYRCVDKYRDYKYHLRGDLSQYDATNTLSLGSIVYVETSLVGGSFDIGALGTLTAASVSEATIGGNVRGRDAAFDIPSGTALAVKGELDFGWAEPSAYTYSKSGLVSTNVYTLLPASEPYTPSHTVARKAACELNVINVAAAGALSITKATLDGTLVKLAAGATFTVGDATFKDVVLDLPADAVVNVTNSLVAVNPVELRLSLDAVRQTLVTLPVGKGELKTSDFVVSGSPQFRFSLSVVVEEGLQKLVVTDQNPDVKDATTGYVVLMTADSSSSSTFTIGSYNMAGNWSEPNDPPHPGTNYYTNGKMFRDKGLPKNDKAFKGDSLTQMGSFRISASAFEIADWRVLSNGSKKLDGRTMVTTAGGTWTATFTGNLTVFSGASSPFTLYGGLSATNTDGSVKSSQTYVMDLKIRGAADAALAAEGAVTQAPGVPGAQVVCEFPGDMSEFYGTLTVGTNETIRLGGWGLTNGTLVTRTAYSTITTKNAAYVPVRKFVSQTDTTFDIPAGTKLAITDGADLTGTFMKNGAGTLAFGGTAVAGAGAKLAVTAGSLETLVPSALAGVPVELSSGTSAVVGWKSDCGLDLSQSAVTFAGASFAVSFDMEGETPDADLTVVRKILSVRDTDAAKFANKIIVNKPARGFQARLLAPVSAGGVTTWSAEISKTGLILLFR